MPSVVTQCLYCGKQKRGDDFNREHVLPQSFGTYRDNLVLRNRVCKECNSYFGDNLEVKLARDSLEAFDRELHGVSRSGRRFGRGGTLKAVVTNSGFFEGANVEWWIDSSGEVTAIPLPQVGFTDEKGKTLWFPLDKIPAKSALPFPKGTPLLVKLASADPDIALPLLRDRGFTPVKQEWDIDLKPGDPLDFNMVGSLGRAQARAIAKLAFNYFIHHYPTAASHETFGPIRNFIRFDRGEVARFISLSGGDFLGGLPADQVPVVHGVGIRWLKGLVFGQVTLFHRLHYRVTLGVGGFVDPPAALSTGHVFDPVSREIHPLTIEDGKRALLPWPPEPSS